jgi:CRP-like cAMP-binding protein
LLEPGRAPVYGWFPTTAKISVLYHLSDGTSVETATIGSRGFVGTSLVTGGGSYTCGAVVSVAGEGYRIPAHVITEEFARGGQLMVLLLRHAQALIAQTGQLAACYRHHSLDQQLCRWLLTSIEGSEGDALAMTHEFIADRLGVRRERLTACAGRLRKAGLMRYARGHITVLDRPALESRCCECYAVVNKEYDRLLPGTTPARRPGSIEAPGVRVQRPLLMAA